MSKMIEIRGKEFSEDTVANIMEKAGIHLEPEKYQFKAGDVCVTTYGVLRIIVFNPEANELQSYNTKGSYENHTAEYFQKNNYRKIGELKDFIK